MAKNHKKKRTVKQIDKDIAKIQQQNIAEKNEQAIQLEFARSKMTIKKIVFHKPCMAATWLYERLIHSTQPFAVSQRDFSVILAYVSSIAPEDVVDIAMQALDENNLVRDAYKFIIKNEFTPEEVDRIMILWKGLLGADDDTTGVGEKKS